MARATDPSPPDSHLPPKRLLGCNSLLSSHSLISWSEGTKSCGSPLALSCHLHKWSAFPSPEARVYVNKQTSEKARLGGLPCPQAGCSNVSGPGAPPSLSAPSAPLLLDTPPNFAGHPKAVRTQLLHFLHVYSAKYSQQPPWRTQAQRIRC